MKLVHLSTRFPRYVKLKVNIEYYCKVVRYTFYSLYVFNEIWRRGYEKIKDIIEVGLVACEISCEREFLKRKSRSTSC